MVKFDLPLVLLSLSLLPGLNASPLFPRANKYPVCEASCTGSACATTKRGVDLFAPAADEVVKRHLMINDPDDPPKFYIPNRMKAGDKKQLHWDTMRTDIVSIDDKFKVTEPWEGKKNGKKYSDDIDNIGGYVSGLTGCTGIAVVSEKGYWLAHIMEPAFFNEDRWTRMLDVLRNGWTADNVLKLPSETGEQALAKLQSDTPKKSFSAPSRHSSYLNKANKVQIFISTTKQDAEGGSGYTTKVAELEKFLTTGAGAPFPGAKVTKRQYDRPKSPEEQETLGKTSASKMLVEYTSNQLDEATFDPQKPQKAMWRVWMETQNYKWEWTVGDDSCPYEPAQGSGQKQARAPGASSTSRRGCSRTSLSSSVSSTTRASTTSGTASLATLVSTMVSATASPTAASSSSSSRTSDSASATAPSSRSSLTSPSPSSALAPSSSTPTPSSARSTSVPATAAPPASSAALPASSAAPPPPASSAQPPKSTKAPTSTSKPCRKKKCP